MLGTAALYIVPRHHTEESESVTNQRTANSVSHAKTSPTRWNLQQRDSAFDLVLQRLLLIAELRTSQSRIVARFLLSLHDVRYFPFRLMDLRVLERDTFNDCMTLLGANHERLHPLRSPVSSGELLWERLANFCYLDRLGNHLKATAKERRVERLEPSANL